MDGEVSRRAPPSRYAQFLLISKIWLRGLDSNQDNQLQRLACYRLHYPGVERGAERKV